MAVAVTVAVARGPPSSSQVKHQKSGKTQDETLTLMMDAVGTESTQFSVAQL